MDMIWYDSMSYMGRGSKSDYSETVCEEYGVNNKRECPCDTCPMMSACQANATECSAMRNWCSKGDYADKDVQRLVRSLA